MRSATSRGVIGPGLRRGSGIQKNVSISRINFTSRREPFPSARLTNSALLPVRASETPQRYSTPSTVIFLDLVLRNIAAVI